MHARISVGEKSPSSYTKVLFIPLMRFAFPLAGTADFISRSGDWSEDGGVRRLKG